MIHKPCYICGSDATTPVVVQKFEDRYLTLIDPALNDANPDRAIVRCITCGFLYHDPTLSDREIEIMYDRFRDGEFRNESPDDYFDRITSYPKEQSQNYQKTMVLNGLVRRFAVPRVQRSIYDVGSGGGVFLKTFLDHAEGEWRAYGCEPTPSYADLARRRLGIDVKTGFYAPALFDQQFDVITAIKVIEHAVDPIAMLAGIRKDLLDDGFVYVEVPNSREMFLLPSDHEQLLYTHLHFFSPAVFAYICRRAGFEIVWMDEPESPTGEVDLIVVLKKAPRMQRADSVFPLEDLVSFQARASAGNR